MIPCGFYDIFLEFHVFENNAIVKAIRIHVYERFRSVKWLFSQTPEEASPPASAIPICNRKARRFPQWQTLLPKKLESYSFHSLLLKGLVADETSLWLAMQQVTSWSVVQTISRWCATQGRNYSTQTATKQPETAPTSSRIIVTMSTQTGDVVGASTPGMGTASSPANLTMVAPPSPHASEAQDAKARTTASVLASTSSASTPPSSTPSLGPTPVQEARACGSRVGLDAFAAAPDAESPDAAAPGLAPRDAEPALADTLPSLAKNSSSSSPAAATPPKAAKDTLVAKAAKLVVDNVVASDDSVRAAVANVDDSHVDIDATDAIKVEPLCTPGPEVHGASAEPSPPSVSPPNVEPPSVPPPSVEPPSVRAAEPSPPSVEPPSAPSAARKAASPSKTPPKNDLSVRFCCHTCCATGRGDECGHKALTSATQLRNALTAQKFRPITTRVKVFHAKQALQRSEVRSGESRPASSSPPAPASRSRSAAASPMGELLLSPAANGVAVQSTPSAVPLLDFAKSSKSPASASSGASAARPTRWEMLMAYKEQKRLAKLAKISTPSPLRPPFSLRSSPKVSALSARKPPRAAASSPSRAAAAASPAASLDAAEPAKPAKPAGAAAGARPAVARGGPLKPRNGNGARGAAQPAGQRAPWRL